MSTFNTPKVSSSFRGASSTNSGGLYLSPPAQQLHQVGCNNGTGPNTPMMVHTPYSCQHDLVPTNSVLGSSFHPQNNTQDECDVASSNSSRNSNATGMVHHNSDGSFGPGSSVHEIQPSFSASKGGSSSCIRRSFSEANSTPLPESASSGPFDPWGSDNALTNSNSSFSAFQQQGNDSNNYPSFMMRAPIFDTPVHSHHLGGKVEYLEVPTSGADIPTAAQWNRQHKVFIGHVKFEISADGLRWMIYKLTGIQAGKIEVRGMGCFMVFFNSVDEVFRVRGLHKRVLFDVNGIWFAQNPEQESQLQSYASTVAPSVHAKLPKGLMVVDEETSRRRNKKSKGNTAAATATPQPAAPPTTTTVHVAPPQRPSGGGFQSHTLTAPRPVQAFAGAVGGRGLPVFSAAEMWASQRNQCGGAQNYYTQ